MIFKVYDSDREYLGIIEPINPKVEISLEAGSKSLSFALPLVKENIEMINEEGYIETSDYFYVIKEIEMDQASQFMVYCKPDIEDLTGTVLHVFDAIDSTCNECITQAIQQENLNWRLQFNVNYPNRVQYALSKVTVLECLNQIKYDFELEYWFDTKQKRIDVYAAGGMGKKSGNVLMHELRLAALSHRGETYDFATILYPYGKKGLSIRDINNNKDYIVNHDYSDKDITAYYFNEDIEYAEELKREAEAYLKRISAPVSTFRVKTTVLPPDLSIGDTIYVIDKLKRKKTTKRVVKMTKYLTQPEKDTVELDNEVQNISKMFYQFQDDYRKNIRYIKENISSLE